MISFNALARYPLVLLFPLATAAAGIFTGGGGYNWERDNVWFLGERPVEYCIEISPHFPISKTEARDAVQEALTDWISFFRLYGLDKIKFQGLATQHDLGLALNFREISDCTRVGNNLKFIFGEDLVPKDLIPLIDHNIGMAFRFGFDHFTFRNSGLIFVSEWVIHGQPNRLAHLLKHELGHVFGMKHGSVPVMFGSIGHYIDDIEMSDVLNQIETSTWRYSLLDKDHINFTPVILGGDGFVVNALLPDGGKPFGLVNGRHKLMFEKNRLVIDG